MILSRLLFNSLSVVRFQRRIEENYKKKKKINRL